MKANIKVSTLLNRGTAAQLLWLMEETNLKLSELLSDLINQRCSELRRPKKSHTKMILESGMVGMYKGEVTCGP